MKIFIDINHPAHVHYFRNFIGIMKKERCEFIVSNRDSAIINQLLDYYEIPHIIRNKRPEKQSFLSSILYLFGMIKYCVKYSFKEKPDIYLGFAASQCAITSFLFRKPCILLDDTEHNKMNHTLYKPFCSVILTPFYFKKDLGKKQIYFNAYIEQLYLYSKFYNKERITLSDLGLNKNIPYILFRYITYDAAHDSNVMPLTEEIKKGFIKRVKKEFKVFVSLENDVKDDFYNDYKIKISPEEMHKLMEGASFFISEGATMASESCMLGTPFIYINPLQDVGNISIQTERYPQIAFSSINEVAIEQRIDSMLENPISPEERIRIKKNIEYDTINPTDFLVWFVSNYPISKVVMKNNPDYQNKFK